MRVIRSQMATPVVVALCLAMVSCSSFVGEKSVGSEPQTDSDAPAAVAAAEQQEAQADAQSEAVVDDAEEDIDGDTVHPGSAYVTADRLNVRLAPSLDAEIASVLHGGQRVDVLEVQGGWSRISRYSDEFNEGGSVKVARWVASAYLSATRPEDDTVHVDSASPLGAAINKSDDSHLYRSSFLAAASQLIRRGECTTADFEDIGGWVRSAGRSKSVYFTYCGGRNTGSRIYLDVDSGRIFRYDSPAAASQN